MSGGRASGGRRRAAPARAPELVDPLALLDYRRHVAAHYRDVRRRDVDLDVRCRRFREARDRLFRHHPASPIAPGARARFRGLDYYAYDRRYRVTSALDTEVEPERFDVPLRDDGLLRIERVGRVRGELPNGAFALSVFRIVGYGGGLFLPFRDATSGRTTYGGGRYLLDTVKHADLGSDEGRLVLDFNYAYHPSCAYDARWSCPLAPPENGIKTTVPVGERAYRPWA